jgi:hypothetical protein
VPGRAAIDHAAVSRLHRMADITSRGGRYR